VAQWLCEALAAGVTGAHARAIPTTAADTAIESTRVMVAINWARRPRAGVRAGCRGSVNRCASTRLKAWRHFAPNQFVMVRRSG